MPMSPLQEKKKKEMTIHTGPVVAWTLQRGLVTYTVTRTRSLSLTRGRILGTSPTYQHQHHHHKQNVATSRGS